MFYLKNICVQTFVVIICILSTVFGEPINDIFAAIKAGKDDIVKEIINKHRGDLGSFINKRDVDSGQTPLMMSVLMGREKVVKMLLNEDVVDASIPEKDGYTPLHGAGFQGRAGIARLLLRDPRGLDPKDKHKDGFQPIHRACWGNEPRHAETVKVFVEEGGVEWDAKAKGKTCLEITHNSKTKSWLKKWGSEQESNKNEL